MKKTLAALLHPADNPYRTIGELARTLQHFLSTAHSFRDAGRWGSSGPTEELCNYGGCVNCDEQPWHSGRITPQLFIGRKSIKLKVSVTLKQEIRTSPQCYSRWDFGFLTEQPNPKWNPHRETFAKFLLRGTNYFKNYKGVPLRVIRATSASPK